MHGNQYDVFRKFKGKAVISLLTYNGWLVLRCERRLSIKFTALKIVINYYEKEPPWLGVTYCREYLNLILLVLFIEKIQK